MLWGAGGNDLGLVSVAQNAMLLAVYECAFCLYAATALSCWSTLELSFALRDPVGCDWPHAWLRFRPSLLDRQAVACECQKPDAAFGGSQGATVGRGGSLAALLVVLVLQFRPVLVCP
jgi:hypothetical protein